MAMNRQQKRMLQRQGQLGPDGAPAAQRKRAQQPSRPQPKSKDDRTGPVEFVREVRGELRKVAWPTRSEVANYSLIVLVALILLTAFVGGLDWVFGESILRLFER